MIHSGRPRMPSREGKKQRRQSHSAEDASPCPSQLTAEPYLVASLQEGVPHANDDRAQPS
jgi:hypothetical protein